MAYFTDRNSFYLTNRIGDKRSFTPEGYLVCHDVPIARTGEQLYSKDEIPLEGGPDGLIRISRNDDEVFRPETLASFEGKPVTIEHPGEFVTPDNFREYEKGTVHNVRRGEGLQSDLMIADLVIKDKATIEYVNDHKPEVSCGYESSYRQTAPGRGEQYDIIGNHVALVTNGRAGSRCAIQDQSPQQTKRKRMGKDRFFDQLFRWAFSDESVEEEANKEGESEEQEKKEKGKTGDAVVLKQILAKLKSMDEDIQAMKEKKDEEDEPTEDDILEAEEPEKADTGDLYTGDTAQNILSMIEVIAPGAKLMTADSKGKKAINKAIAMALKTADQELVKPFLAGKEIDKLTTDGLHAVLVGVSALQGARNNIQPGFKVKDNKTSDASPAAVVRNINERQKAFWAGK